MSWSRLDRAVLVMGALLTGISEHAEPADLPSSPVPRKTLPAPAGAPRTALPGDLDPAERVDFYREQADVQAKLELSHRQAAREWRSRLAEELHPQPAKPAAHESWLKQLQAQANDELVPPDLPPLPSSGGRDRDRAVFEAVLKDVIDCYFPEDEPRKAGWVFVLHAKSYSDTMPGDFQGLLEEGKVAKGLAEELETELGRRNAGGPTRLDDLRFKNQRIVVKDLDEPDALTGVPLNELSGYAFRDNHLEIEGYALVYLPAYTKDRKTAAVRMFLGPPADTHGRARYSGIVVETQGKWSVKWKSISHPE